MPPESSDTRDTKPETKAAAKPARPAPPARLDNDDVPLGNNPAPGAEPEREGPPPGYKLSDRDLDQIAEVITAEQIDRLVRLRARIDRRDGYRAKGIKPSTHVVMCESVVGMVKGKRTELRHGAAVEIAHLEPEFHEELLAKGLAERPE